MFKKLRAELSFWYAALKRRFAEDYVDQRGNVAGGDIVGRDKITR